MNYYAFIKSENKLVFFFKIIIILIYYRRQKIIHTYFTNVKRKKNIV